MASSIHMLLADVQVEAPLCASSRIEATRQYKENISMRELPETSIVNNRMSSRRFSSRPLYLQTRDAIAERISSGEWKQHTTIPDEGELARELGVSPSTMRKALDLAEAERLLTRHQGGGRFVSDPLSDKHAERYSCIRGRDGKRLGGEVKVLSLLETTVNEREVRRLRLRLRERVHRVRRLRLTGGKPYMLEDIVMPTKLFPRLATHFDASQRLSVLAQQYGVSLGGGEERVTASGVAPDVADALEVEPATTVMRLDRVIYTLEGKPAVWRLGQCPIVGGRHYLAKLTRPD
ncbi:GntR family transcriptional regulator [Bradyrhizobium sp. LHD-71]|uniref:GntR family transcriptional regulator n=1 Tax=Bradyrhizobium sp. LHD-71 TaxID=3072141 RepID=UPI0028103E8F|nr:GntR family transcriptional regulator [Bradyrhizobium sp. LHD-71]MDQ8729179.1 GntR family transcriptional regulator [Bradyrhizobium sp. LHD-71]